MTCTIPGCERDVYLRGLCNPHYQRDVKSKRICTAPNCTTPARIGRLCKRHARIESGKPAARGPNEVIVVGDDAYVIVTDLRGNVRGRIVIDAACVPLLGSRRWHTSCGGYLTSGRRDDLVVFHRLVTKAPDGFEVDHIDGNRANNRRSNLRVVTRPENCQNFGTRASSGHRNVYVHPDSGYTVYLTKNRKRYYGGAFRTLDEAVAAARRLRRVHYTHAVEARH